MSDRDGKGPRARSPRPSVRFGGLKRGIRYSKKISKLKYGKGKPVKLSKKVKTRYPKKAKVDYKIEY